MYCPNWIFDIAVARTASEYLSSEIGVDAFAKKYAEGLSEIYNDVPVESILGPAEAMMLFLAEIEAGDMAVELLNDFASTDLQMRLLENRESSNHFLVH